MTKALRLPEGLDTTKPSPARIYDYMLRGTSHFDVDEEAAKRILTAVPEIKDCAWSNRGFHQRAAAWIARQGVRQFIDIGSGLPTIGNTHEVVKKIHPDARVVYVDNDPMVELYSQTILDEGSVSVICADLREPDAILSHPSVRALLDSRGADRPADDGRADVRLRRLRSVEPGLALRAAVGPGSYLSLSHITDDAKPPLAVDGFRRVFDQATEQMHFRSKTAIGAVLRRARDRRPVPGRRALAHVQWPLGRRGRTAGGQRRVPLALLRGGEGPVMNFSAGAAADTISMGVEAGTGTEGKPTPDELGIDVARLVWQRSGEGDGSIEIAFPLSAALDPGRLGADAGGGR